MIKELDEFEVLKGLKDQDEAAFHQFYYAHHKRTETLVGRLVKDRDDVKSITNDAFCKLWEHAPRIPQFESMSFAVSYLLTIAKNLALNHLEKLERQGRVEKYSDTISDVPDLAQLVVENEIYLKIHEAILSLSDDMREVMERIYVQGMTLLEVTQELNISYDAAQKRKKRAEKILPQKLRKWIYVLFLFKLIVSILIYLWRELSHSI